MHELSVARSVVELVEAQPGVSRAVSVDEVELEIGRLAGVLPEALDFALKSAVRNTRLETARIVCRYIAGEGRCTDCGTVFPMTEIPEACPSCGSWWVAVVRGKELRVKSILVSGTQVPD